MANCMMYDIEFEMNSELNGHILADLNYITYDALKANKVPCSRQTQGQTRTTMAAMPSLVAEANDPCLL